MRTNLFKSLLVAVMAIGAMGGVKAQIVVTETYEFLNWSNTGGADSKFTTGGEACKTGDKEDGTSVYYITNKAYEKYSLDRFATNTTKNLYIRGNKGVFCPVRRTAYFSILNLKDGDVITIKTPDAPKFKSTNVLIDGKNVNVDDQVQSDKEYTVSTTGKTTHLDLYFEAYDCIHNIAIKTTVDKEEVEKPTISVVGVNGMERTVAITANKGNLGSTPEIYYTTNNETPTKASTKYTKPFSISSTTTVKAIAYISDEVVSDVESNEVAAGTEVSLATPTFEITNLTEDNGVFKPTYTIAIDNSNVLCSPKATFSAQFNGEDVANFDGTFNVDTKGNLVVTASANGYTSTSISINVNNYIYSKNVYFDNISESNLTERLGEGWTASENSTRWASWSLTNGIDKNLNKTGDDKYYTATHTGAFTVDFANFSNGTDLLFGYGFGSIRGNRTATIPNAPKGSMAKYNVCGWGNIELSKYVDYNKGGELPYTIEKNYYALRSIELYLPATETVSVSEAGFATYATKHNVEVPSDVEVMTVKVNAAGTAIELNKVEAGTVIPAGKGILVKADQGNHDFVITSKEGTTLENNNLVAATTDVLSDGAKYYALTKIGDKVGFAKVAKDVVIPAGKAYLMVENGESAKFFGLDGEATGINSVKTAKVDGAYYTLEGVKTTKPVKGIYIHNGKKIVVK